MDGFLRKTFCKNLKVFSNPTVLVKFVNDILQFGVKASEYNSEFSLELFQIDHHLEK